MASLNPARAGPALFIQSEPIEKTGLFDAIAIRRRRLHRSLAAAQRRDRAGAILGPRRPLLGRQSKGARRRWFGSSGPVARTTVNYPNNHAPGTIVINTSERRLYLVLG